MNNNFIESFFDENDQNYKLWSKSDDLLDINEKDIIYQGTLLKMDRNSNKTKPRYFILTKNKLYYLKSENAKKARGVMKTEWVRIEYFKENENTDNPYFVVRFIKNMKYCDFMLVDKSKLEIWKKNLSKVFIQSNFHKKFNAVKMIGKGSFARVYLVENKKTGEKFAVKAFSKEYLSSQPKGKMSLMNEIKIMKMLDNEFIMTLHEIHESKNSIYLVLELLEGGELFSLISKKKNLSVKIVHRIMNCLLKSLAYLQFKGIMHRDLKPENMILKEKSNLENCTLKLVDFGLAEICDKEEYLFKRCGTPGYVAPEIINSKKEEKTKFTPVVDVFSAGVILYIMIIGKSPFGGKTFHQILEQNKICKINLEIPKINKHPLIKELLKQMLNPDGEERISAQEALLHDFFKSMDEEEDEININLNLNKLSLDKNNSGMKNSFVVRENVINGNIDTVKDTSNGGIMSLRKVNKNNKNDKNDKNDGNCRPSIYKYVLMKEKEKQNQKMK